MSKSESSYWEDWFRIAEMDLQRVARCLAEHDVEDAAFHLQQALEKYLKGFLLYHGWKLQRHHNLVDLIREAAAFLPGLSNFRDLGQEVTQYYMIERYPLFVNADIDPSDLEGNFKVANELIAQILESIKGTDSGP